MKYNYDYSKTMMMKIALAKPDGKGGSYVWANFEKALENIKLLDNMTFGAPKIVYLVGWQYLGHDDKYPAFFEVNEHLKRAEDATAKESLLWLIAEAKKYHTVVSLHINLSDAYQDSPLWQEYIDHDLILKKPNGKLKVTGKWYNRNAYQVRFAREYESGYFKKRVDQLLELLPIEALGTIHVDAFFARKGKDTAIETEKAARLKMIAYFRTRGIDVTSEFIYRERKNGYRAHFGFSDTVGAIPAFWNLVLSRKDILKYPACELAGGIQLKSLTPDKSLEWLFYGNIQAENLMKDGDNWEPEFLRQFITYNVPYFFLNEQKRVSVKGMFRNRRCEYTQNVTAFIKNKAITASGITLKENENLCLPMSWKKGCYAAYANDAGRKRWSVCGAKAKIYFVDKNGKTPLKEVMIEKGFVNFDAEAKSAYLIEVTG